MPRSIWWQAVIICLSTLAWAQFPSLPSNITRFHSSKYENIWIDYKPVSICETNENSRNFAGYVHLPSNFLSKFKISQPLDQNIFFWFFESRSQATAAPLTIYLNGGPGASSTRSIFREHGPCKINADSSTTRPNPWSWNGESSMLYVDQPGNAGFSYDNPQNASFNIQSSRISFNTGESVIPDQRHILAGTVGAGFNDINHAINSSEAATRMLWQFLEIWLDDFPEYNSTDNDKVNIWTSSYGGHYGPALVNYTLTQNRAIDRGKSSNANMRRINIDTLGMTNACLDVAVQLPFYPEMAYNNTYGIQLINETTYGAVLKSLHAPKGCLDLVQKCRAAVLRPDLGNQPVANELCHEANRYCGEHVVGVAKESGRNMFDIAFPSYVLGDPLISTNLGYLKQSSVQQGLGVPVNYSVNADAVTHAFARTGDNAKGGALEALAEILDYGINVAMIYGDRDFACNWLGGEAASLSIEHRYQQGFKRAGYKNMTIGNVAVGAQVRQYGNLSFIRVNDAAHGVASNQPEIAYEIFNRANARRDIATGSTETSGTDLTDIYATTGPGSTFDIKNTPPEIPPATCYTLNLAQCSPEQVRAFFSGEGIIEDYFLVNYGDGRCSPNPVRPCETRKPDLPASLSLDNEYPSRRIMHLTLDWTIPLIITVLTVTSIFVFALALMPGRRELYFVQKFHSRI